MASLLLKDIYKVYQSGVVAVTDFTLDIEDKEFIGHGRYLLCVIALVSETEYSTMGGIRQQCH